MPDVNRSVVGLRPGRRGRRRRHGEAVDRVRPLRGAQRRRRASSACSSPSGRPTGRSPTSTTSASGSTSRSSTRRRIESLIKAGGVRLPRPPPPGPARGPSSRSSTRTIARRRERDMGVMSLFGEVDDAGPMFDERPPIPDVEFDKRERLSLREGDARPLRQRPPADGRRGVAAAQAATARSPTSPRWTTAPSAPSAASSPASSGSGPEGRPHGRVHAGGPPDRRSRSWCSPRR